MVIESKLKPTTYKVAAMRRARKYIAKEKELARQLNEGYAALIIKK